MDDDAARQNAEMRELLREIFAAVPEGSPSDKIPDSNPFDLRVSVGQLRRWRKLRDG